MRGVAVPSSHDPAVYLEALAGLGCTVDAWETTYLHVLQGPDPVFTWVSGTGARPTLQALPDDLRPAFEEEFKRRLRAAYPERDGRVVLPFRRIFVVARGRMIALHHVQVACPPGGEDDARRFYAEGLGLTEVEKPAALRDRGGVWFRAYDAAGEVVAEVHVGVEDPFTPARKAHPAFVVDDLDAVAASWPPPASPWTQASARPSTATCASTPTTARGTGSRSSSPADPRECRHEERRSPQRMSETELRRGGCEMATLDLTETSFEKTVTQDGIVLVDFWASWCGPCRMFAPVYEKASETHDDITFASIDTEAEQMLSGALQITSIPTLMAFRDGIMVFRQAGALPAPALEELITAVRGLDMDDVRRQVEQGASDTAKP